MNVPKTSEIKTLIVAGLEASLNQTIPLWPKAFNRVIAAVLAGVFTTLYKYAGFVFLQMFIRTASEEQTEINGRQITPLNAWGELVGKGDPTPATKFEGDVEVVVDVQTGSLESGIQLLNQGNGFVYLSLSTVALDAATKTLSLRAAGDQAGGNGSGAAGNLQVGDVLSFVTKPENCRQTVTVTAVTVTAADAQDTDEYRQEVIDRFRRIPMGGAYHDYWLWGIEPSGIIEVYPYRGNPGEVNVYCEATPASSGSEYGYPTSAQLDAVFDAIQYDNGAGKATRRPVGAYVERPNIQSITRVFFDVEIVGLQDPNNQKVAILEDMATEAQKYFAGREPFIEGLTSLPRVDLITSAGVAGVLQPVADGYGAYFERADLYVSSVLNNAYSLLEGEKSWLGNVTEA